MTSRIASRALTLVLLPLLLLAAGVEARTSASQGTIAEVAGDCSSFVAARAQFVPAPPLLLPAGESRDPGDSRKGSHTHGACGCHVGGTFLLPACDAAPLQPLIFGALSLLPAAAALPRVALLPYLLPYATAPPATS